MTVFTTRILSEQTPLSDKIQALDQVEGVKEFIAASPKIRAFLEKASQEEAVAVKSVIALGEGANVFQDADKWDKESLQGLADTLVNVESYYRPIGGIVGYHREFLRLLEPEAKSCTRQYLQPPAIDIASESDEVRQAIRWAIEHLGEMAEIYPVGGAGDRLSLVDEKSGEPLPAANLPFLGDSLLSILVRDLQAREYLHYKLIGKSVITPIALMTSQEKRNAEMIEEICERNHWFGRPKDAYFSFVQPLVPVITMEGRWSLQGPLELTLKPGGHGVLWKLAYDSGMFDWLEGRGRSRALVRQINNPIAGTDYGLLAFFGLGGSGGRTFGFASCERRIGSAEGMNVLIENKVPEGYAYCISNIEYTDFKRKGVEEVSKDPDSPYSTFPANTNILYADLPKLKPYAKQCPVPGLLVNFKHTFPVREPGGESRELPGGRLETTMQNIADEIVDIRKERSDDVAHLQTFLTSNRREKTLSVTKTLYEPGNSSSGTPEGAYHTLYSNAMELLEEKCGMTVPRRRSREEYLKEGPGAHVLYHPALGPLYSIISQKIRGGKIEEGAELQLNIAELELENLALKGSLLIHSESPLGLHDSTYSDEGGKCTLRNVKVRNQGIDTSGELCFWENRIPRKEACRILIHGSGEFFAENITFQGSYEIEVPDGIRLTARQDGEKVRFESEAISGPTWSWSYAFDQENRIVLKRKEV